MKYVVLSILVIFAVLIILVSNEHLRNVTKVDPPNTLDDQNLKTGDVLLCQANNCSNIRKRFTASQFTHVAMIYRNGSDIYVLESRASGMPSIISLESYRQQWNHVYGNMGIRRLKCPMTHQEQKRMDDCISELLKIGKRTKLQEYRELGLMCADWIYNNICLQNTSFFRPLGEIRFLCTDTVVWLFLKCGILHSRPVVVTPEFFITQDLDSCSNVHWDPKIYSIRSA